MIKNSGYVFFKCIFGTCGYTVIFSHSSNSHMYHPPTRKTFNIGPQFECLKFLEVLRMSKNKIYIELMPDG